MQAVVFLAVPFIFVTHKLGLAVPCQTIVIVKDELEVRSEEGGRRSEEGAGEPFGLISVHVVVAERAEVICHVKELLHLNLHRFDVTDVQQPVAVGTSGIGLQQLLVHQHRCRGGYP